MPSSKTKKKETAQGRQKYDYNICGKFKSLTLIYSHNTITVYPAVAPNRLSTNAW